MSIPGHYGMHTGDFSSPSVSTHIHTHSTHGHTHTLPLQLLSSTSCLCQTEWENHGWHHQGNFWIVQSPSNLIWSSDSGLSDPQIHARVCVCVWQTLSCANDLRVRVMCYHLWFLSNNGLRTTHECFYLTFAKLNLYLWEDRDTMSGNRLMETRDQKGVRGAMGFD